MTDFSPKPKTRAAAWKQLGPRGRRNAQWLEEHIFIPEGRLVGKPLELTPAQLAWIGMIYDSPTRMFILSMPRKQAKTATTAMLMLLHLVGPEAVQNGQLYSTAQSRDQAAVLFGLAARMVRMSPVLAQYVAVRDSAKELFCAELGTRYKALSADASTALGLSPVFHASDETGSVRGPRSELFEALETASAAQDKPLTIVLSTQAPTDADFLSVLIDDAKQGKDSTIKLALYSVPEDADPFDMDVLAAAHPNWELVNHDEVRRMAESAKRMPSREASFRNLIANQRVNASNPFISRAAWEACAGEVDFSAFEDDVFIGLDLSARHDLTAAVAVARKEGVWHVLPTFFVPSQGIEDRSARDRVPYDVWADQGHLVLTPGSTVDYEFVARWLAGFCDDHGVRSIRFDRWRMDVFKAELSRIGVELPMTEFGQGYKSMTPALDTLEAEIANGNVRHGGHPVLTMCAANAVAVSDPAGNRKLDKSKATGRIDGMVALAMAIGGASEALAPAAPPEFKVRFFSMGAR